MEGKADIPERTFGVDVGDRYSQVCVLDGAGEIVEEGRVRNLRSGTFGWTTISDGDNSSRPLRTRFSQRHEPCFSDQAEDDVPQLAELDP